MASLYRAQVSGDKSAVSKLDWAWSILHVLGTARANRSVPALRIGGEASLFVECDS